MARVDLDEDDGGRSYRAAVGDLVIIRLAETPTSGYRWLLEPFDAGVLAPAGDTFRPAADTGLGGGGTRQLRFGVVGPGTAVVRLALRRGWQAGEPAARRFEVTIQAAGDATG